jgi:hypothetical protein
MQKGVEALGGIFVPFVGEGSRDHGRFELGMAQVALDEPGIHAGFKEMGGVGMPQGRDGDAHFGDPSPVFGGAEGALDTAPTHGSGRGRALLVIPSGGGKEPGGVTMGFPIGTEQREGLGGQRDVPVFGALAAGDMDLKALAIDVGDLQGQGFMEPEAETRDGGEGDLVVQGGGGRKEPPDLLHTEDSGELVGGVRAEEREGVPVALEDVLGEEADTAGAEAHGRWSQAIDVFAVEEVTLKFRFRDAVGGCVGELGQEADFPDIRFLGPFARAAELESRQHVLTQGGHEMSPFVR